MKPAQILDLKPTLTPGAQVTPLGDGTWHLEIPPGPKGHYRVAQMDDYGSSPRRSFPWKPPVQLSLRLRASANNLPGTWGIGLWNNPFGMAILKGAEVLRLPALPNAAWFFFASPPNFLSLRDDLPAQGMLAATFRSSRWPSSLLWLTAPALPFLLFPGFARLLRQAGRRVVQQDATLLSLVPEEWHTYTLEWQPERVTFLLDGQRALETNVAPYGPLGLVLWVDNQFAALPPVGRPSFGTLANPSPACIEIADLHI